MKIDILDSDFVRLKALAEPFIDTPGSVISKLLDAYEGVQVAPTVPTQISRENVFSLEDMPPLTHAKIMGGHFAGKKPAKQNWDSFVRHSLVEVLKKCGSVDDLRRLSGANVREGHYDERGYKHVAEYKFSFQGVSAEDAVKIIARCARALSAPFEIEFVWRDNPDAHRPGERATIKYP